MKILCLLFSMLVASPVIYSKGINKDFYQIKVYHLKNNGQVVMTDQFLKESYLPALHRLKIKNIGVFKPVANDTATDKLIYVLIPFASARDWEAIFGKLEQDAAYQSSAKNFIEAASTNPPFERVESILLEAFSGQPHLVLPSKKNQQRVFELRSYESPTLHLFGKKVAMINSGGEIQIFNRLGFNPVFYGKVVSGSHMPNLMYMPVFENVPERDAQWKNFGADARWKEISADPQHENKVSVSHIDSILMHSTEYSDY